MSSSPTSSHNKSPSFFLATSVTVTANISLWSTELPDHVPSVALLSLVPFNWVLRCYWVLIHLPTSVARVPPPLLHHATDRLPLCLKFITPRPPHIILTSYTSSSSCLQPYNVVRATSHICTLTFKQILHCCATSTALPKFPSTLSQTCMLQPPA